VNLLFNVENYVGDSELSRQVRSLICTNHLSFRARREILPRCWTSSQAWS